MPVTQQPDRSHGQQADPSPHQALTSTSNGSSPSPDHPTDRSATPSAARHRTFRDPAGWVELHKDAAYRFVHPQAQADLLDFLATPLAQRLAREHRLAATEVLDRVPDHLAHVDPQGGLLVLRHPLVPFISYPWEWCPAQWLAAAELTLALCRDLLQEGWILKDATPLNILFRGAQPILVDVASVARLDPHTPLWYPYSQFIRTFLLPLLAHTQLGWPLRTTLFRRDGLEPEDIYPALTPLQRLRQPALSAVTLPTLLARTRSRPQAAAASEKPRQKDPELVLHVLQGTLQKLGKQIRRAMPRPRASTWTAYSGTATHYTEADHATKQSFVASALQTARPQRVLDVGANAGVYSRLATGAGAEVVAIDTDLQTLDRLQTQLHATPPSQARPGPASPPGILPLVLDLANPTPGAGWRNRESSAFLTRAIGHFDGLIMLAVLHHLLLHDHIPLPEVAQLAATLTTRTLILEWVPPSDPMFRELVRGRDALFASITESAFRQDFGQHFTVLGEHTLLNGRILFHMQRNDDAGCQPDPGRLSP